MHQPSLPGTSDVDHAQRPLTSLEVIRGYRDFRLIWAGNFAAQSVQWLQMLTVGWLVLHLTEGNALLTGTVVGIRTLPVLLIGPWAGVLADRMDRRKLVMVSQSVMAVIAALFAVMVLSTDLDSDPMSGPLRWWHPFIYMALAGIAHAIIQPVRQAMVVNTVPSHGLTSALALNGMVYPTTRILAPAIGGVLIATLGFKWNFFLEAMAYLGIVLSLLPARLPYRSNNSGRHASALTSLVDGVRYVWRDKTIVQLIALAFIPNFIFQPVTFLLPVFTSDVLGRQADAGGMLAAGIGVGGVCAAVIIAVAGFVLRKGAISFAGLIGGCVFVVLFSQSQWLMISFALLAGMGFCQYVFRVSNGILVQTIVTDDMRGRVTSLYQLEHGLAPLGTLIISSMVHFWNPADAVTAVGAAALGGAVLMAFAFRAARRLE